MPVQFRVMPHSHGVVEIQFSERLGALARHGAYEILERLLNSIDGVDQVEMSHYVCLVRVAEHVRSVASVCGAIDNALDSDPELELALLEQFNGHEVVVHDFDDCGRPRTLFTN